MGDFFWNFFVTLLEYMNFSSDFEGLTWNSPSILSGKGRSKTELLTTMHLFWRGLSGEIVKTPLPFILPLTNVPSKSYLEYEIGKHGFVIARPEGQWISKYEIKSIWNCINFSQNTNKRHYSEQLYRLGMFLLWQIAVARPLSSASLTYLECNYFSGEKNKLIPLFFESSFGMTIFFRDLLTFSMGPKLTR